MRNRNKQRREARHTGRYTAAQRMVVAGRVAAITLFANRGAIWLGSLCHEITPQDVQLQDLMGGEEKGNGLVFQVGEDALRETLNDTALFSSRGPQRMGFAHRYYAEFLAAWYFVEHDVKAERILGLLRHPEDREDKIVPQLQGIAAWLAGMNSDVFNALCKSQPEVLLGADEAGLSLDQREMLVDALLRACERGDWVDSDRGLRRQYRKLVHPKLRGQLLPYLQDPSKGVIVRRVAVDIAEACEVRELQRELLQIALIQEENIYVRSQAADTLVKVGDAKARKCLKPLAFGLAGDDPEDELKGAALQALWPEHLSAAELFEALTIPKRPNLFGSYRYFLQYDLIAGLRPTDLPKALTWVESLLRGRELDYNLRQFVDAILRHACKFLDEPGVIEGFARVAWALLKEDHPIFESKSFESKNKDSVANPLEDDEIRRKVLSAILPLVENQAEDPWQLESLVKSQDMPWLIQQLKHEDSTQLRQLWAEPISVAFRFVPDQINLVLDACEDEPQLAERFRWLREPILLGSEEADKQREWYQREQARRQGRHREPLDPPPAHRIAMQLAASESGNASAWVGLCFDLTLKEDSKHYQWPTADLRRTPGWEQADATTRGRIIAAARHYLLEAQPNPKALLSSGPFRTGDIAGYPALRLLLQEDPSFLQDADEEFWGKWTLLVLDPHHSDEDKNAHEQLLRVAYQRAPQSILAGLGQLIDKESSRPVYIVNKVKAIWDDDIAETILDRVKNPGLSAQGLEKLLGVLLEHGSPDAQLFATSLIATPITTSGEERERALIAGETLFRYARDHGWSAVWGAIQADPAFGRDLMLCISSSSAGIQRLTDDQAADLFAWLTQQFPRTEDPEPPDEVHGVIPRLELARFRDGIVRQLKERGTSAACRAIARLVAQFPEQLWLKWTLREAEALARQRTWPPPIPAEVLAIATDPNKRLVRSGDELLDVIIESIKRLEEKLHGVTPLVRFLWNELGSTCRPKDENDFSDFADSTELC